MSFPSLTVTELHTAVFLLFATLGLGAMSASLYSCYEMAKNGEATESQGWVAGLMAIFAMFCGLAAWAAVHHFKR